MNTEFGQFIIHRPEKARSACRIFVSKNFPEQEKILGKLFGIIEVETDSPDKRKYQILDSIINELEKNYYYNKKIFNSSFGKIPEKVNIETSFEGALKQLNEKIIELMQGGEIYLPLKRLHLIFGVLRDNNLCFTAHGQMHAYLVFEGKQKSQKIINILDTTKEPVAKNGKAKPAAAKIFSNIISGKLNQKNSLLFSTNTLFDYLSSDRLKKTLLTEKPAEAVNTLKLILSGVSPYVTFAALVIKLLPETVPAKGQAITRPQSSIQGLLNTEDRTKEILSPSFKLNFKKYLGYLADAGAYLKSTINKTKASVLSNIENFKTTRKAKKEARALEAEELRLQKELSGQSELPAESTDQISPAEIIEEETRIIIEEPTEEILAEEESIAPEPLVEEPEAIISIEEEIILTEPEEPIEAGPSFWQKIKNLFAGIPAYFQARREEKTETPSPLPEMPAVLEVEEETKELAEEEIQEPNNFEPEDTGQGLRERIAASLKNTGNSLKTSSAGAMAGLAGFFRQAWRIIQNAVKIFFHDVRSFLAKISLQLKDAGSRRRKSIEEKFSPMAADINKKIDSQIAKFFRLPNKNKLFLALTIILIFIFVESLVYLDRQRAMNGGVNFDQLVQEIQGKINESEAALIYADEDKARALLAEANSLLRQLPENTISHKKTVENIETALQAGLDRVNRLVEIAEPALIANLASVEDNGAQNLVGIGSSLYSLDNLNNAYEINPIIKTIANLEITKDDIGKIKFETLMNPTTLLFYTDRNILAALDLKAKTLKKIDFTLGEADLKDITFFNSRLYSVDAKNNLIYRYAKTATGFSKGQAWTRERGVDVSNTVSIALDGSLYDLKANGEIYKFMSGYRRDFELKPIEPKLANPTKMIIPENSIFIYILDKTNQRLVVIDKLGKLKAQYHSDKFTDLKDFTVDEKEKKIYLLNGTEIFGIMATHL